MKDLLEIIGNILSVLLLSAFILFVVLCGLSVLMGA